MPCSCSSVLLVSFVVCGWAGAVHATSDPETIRYRVEGFSKDGRHVLFRKDYDGGATDCAGQTWYPMVFLVPKR